MKIFFSVLNKHLLRQSGIYRNDEGRSAQKNEDMSSMGRLLHTSFSLFCYINSEDMVAWALALAETKTFRDLSFVLLFPCIC